jgi:hypothetical protein
MTEFFSWVHAPFDAVISSSEPLAARALVERLDILLHELIVRLTGH